MHFLNYQKTAEKQKLKLSHIALFHIKTRVCPICLVHECNLKFFKKLRGRGQQNPRKNITKKRTFIWEQAALVKYLHVLIDIIHIPPYKYNPMLTCVQIQLKGSSREIDQQVKQYEAWNLNKLC